MVYVIGQIKILDNVKKWEVVKMLIKINMHVYRQKIDVIGKMQFHIIKVNVYLILVKLIKCKQDNVNHFLIFPFQN